MYILSNGLEIKLVKNKDFIEDLLFLLNTKYNPKGLSWVCIPAGVVDSELLCNKLKAEMDGTIKYAITHDHRGFTLDSEEEAVRLAAVDYNDQLSNPFRHEPAEMKMIQRVFVPNDNRSKEDHDIDNKGMYGDYELSDPPETY